MRILPTDVPKIPCRLLLKLPPTREMLFVLHWFGPHSAALCGCSIHTLSPWYLQDRFFDLLLVFNLLDTSINTWAASIFQKVWKKFWSWRPSYFFLVKFRPCHPDTYLQNSFFEAPGVQHTGYYYRVLISGLHQFFRRKFWSWLSSLIFLSN